MVVVKEKNTNDEEKVTKKEEHKDNTNHTNKDMKKYMIFAGLFLAFILGIILTNFFNNMIVGNLSSENTNIVNSLQQEKETLRIEKENAVLNYDKAVAEKTELMDEKAVLEQDVEHLDMYLVKLSNEANAERKDPLRYYKAIWEKFLLVKVGETIETDVTIENIGVTDRDYELEVLLLSRYNNPTEGSPTAGTLTLNKGGSGKIKLKFTPKEEGYARYGLYINNDYIGDMIVFARG